MGFIMDGLDAEGYDRTYDDRELLNRILDYFRTRKRLMAGVAFVIILNALLNTSLPILISRMIDTFATDPRLERAYGLDWHIFAVWHLVMVIQFFAPMAHGSCCR